MKYEVLFRIYVSDAVIFYFLKHDEAYITPGDVSIRHIAYS